MPLELPKGVKASIVAGAVNIEGPKGKLTHKVPNGISVSVENGVLLVVRAGDDRQSRSNHGTTRSILENMALGVDKGWTRGLELNGVGFTAKLQGTKLVLAVGFSHDVEMELPKGIKCVIEKNQIKLESADRDAVGLFASKVRKVQPPEPYLGKGIKYVEEVVRRKAGKAGKK